MKNENQKIPDHTLANVNIDSVDEPPEVYAVTDLRAFVKPELDEELRGSDAGMSANYGQTICSCVPVETCVCNTVTYHQGGGSNPCDHSCVCVCVGLYWYPY